MKKYALIVAGGNGTRMNLSIPKQFIELKGRPILMHTFDSFLKTYPSFQFILVLPKNQISTWKSLCQKHSFTIPHTLTTGGESRFHSVKNGLTQLNEEGIVFIHDGVRPLVSSQTIKNCYQTALKYGNALPVITPSESIREEIRGNNRWVDRRHYFLVQTPQTFKIKIIKKAYTIPYSPFFTDDASVLEHFGEKIHLVEGNRENIKITWPEDLIIAEAFLK